MRKLTSLKLMLVALVAMLSMNASAAETLVGKTIFKAPFKYTIKTVNATAKTGTVSVAKNDAEAETSLTIPKTFSETVEGTEFTGTMTFTVVQIEANGFEGLSNLTTVSIPESVTEIGANAFSGDYALTTLTIAENSELVTIGNEAFNSWISATFDLSKATKLTTLPANLLTTASARAGAGNTYVTTVVLPTSITTPSTALAYLPNLATLNIADTKTATVAANFLANNAKITELTLPATVKTINVNALQNSAVKKLTINSYQTDASQTIGAFGADLDKVTVKDEFKGTFNGAGNVKEIEFAGKFSGTIEANAFTKVEKVTFNEFNGTIETAGIALAGDKGEVEVTFGQISKVIATNAITGFTQDADNYVTLKVGKINTNCGGAGAIVSTGVKSATVTGAVANALNLDMFADAATLTFQDKITAAITGTTANTTLKTLNLGAIEITAGVFGDASLQNYTGINAVTWKPADDKATKAFDKAAFFDASHSMDVTFTTTTKVAYNVSFYAWDGTTDATLYGVTFVATAPEAEVETTVIKFEGEVAEDGYYYATVYIPQGKKARIDKTNGFTMYSVYLDGSKIYNNPLRVINDKYYINGASPINAGLIVKSKSNEDVTITYDDGITQQSIQNAAYALGDKFDGLLYNAGPALPGAKIIMEDPYFTLVDNDTKKYSEVIAAPYNKVIVRVSDPKTTKSVKYGDFDPTAEPTKGIESKGFFLLADPVAAGSRQVVWLDDEGSVTAIENVEIAPKAAGSISSDAIYNIAGQKVGADYKGLVIKNGKKYIQK